jgi:hypothetical protein
MHPHIPWKIQMRIQKWKITKEERIGVCSLVHSILGVEGHVGAPRWGLGRMTNESIIHMNLQKPNKLVSVCLKHF